MNANDRRQAIRQGRNAVLRAIVEDDGRLPANPYRQNTKRGIFWQLGADRAARVLKPVMEIGA